MIDQKPDNFVEVRTIIPDIQIDMRYYTDNNYIGNPLVGYNANKCLMTKETALALKKVQAELAFADLSLKIYDAYRPRSSGEYASQWGKDIDGIRKKQKYYPDLEKDQLFKSGYIADPSCHNRGSAVDVIIVPRDIRTDRTMDYRNGIEDQGLDFGTCFDFFGNQSRPDYQDFPMQIKANRLLLRKLMIDAGFEPFEEEWWHFTLVNEPYPDTYFNFPIE